MKRADSAFTIAMGQRMLKRRQELGLTQEEVIERARLSPTQYSHIESGNYCARSDSLRSISAALEISADYLLTGETHVVYQQELACMLEDMSESQLRFMIKMGKELMDHDAAAHADAVLSK